MAEFVFVSPQGRFPIPVGESRIGSDSSCPICVQGEGVLPVHAYLKLEGERVLIRPFSERAALTVDGGPVAGPQVLARGQRISLGALELRLDWQRRRRRFPWRVLMWLGGALAVILLILTLLRFFWFNEAWWKEQILAAVESALGRENAELDAVHLDLLGGHIRLENLRVPNREPFPADTVLLRVDEVEFSVDAWKFLRSGFTQLRAGRLKLVHPELSIQRVERDGRAVSNVDDLPARLGERGSRWVDRLTALEAVFEIENGCVRLRDDYAHLDESRLEGITVTLKQPGFGEKLTAHLEATSVAAEQTSGKVTLDGAVLLFSAAGRIEPPRIGPGSVQLGLSNFDLARLCRHLQWEWRVRGGRQRVVPGKPVSGAFEFKFDDLRSCEVRGHAESESLLTLLEEGRPPIGNIPTLLDVEDLTYDFVKGRPAKLELTLRSAQTLADAKDPARSKVVLLRASGKSIANGDEKFVVDLSTLLQDLCATDIGERLKLKGRLAGRLTARAEMVHDAARGETRMEAQAKLSDDARVLVQHPTDPRQSRWQPVRLDIALNATAHPNARGELSSVEAKFTAHSDSFDAKSTTDARVEFLDEWDKLRINTQFQMDLRGREFWIQFGPVLGLFGFERPIEEILSLNVTVYSGAEETGAGPGTRRISFAFKGQASRQWREDPAPVSLDAIVDYFPEVFAESLTRPAPAAVAAPAEARPYLRLTLQTGDPQHLPYVRVEEAELCRAGTRETIRVPRFWVQSDMAALRERFQPYVQRLGEYLAPEFLKGYSLDGYVGVGDRSSLFLVRDTGTQGAAAQPRAADFDLSVTGKDVTLGGPLFSEAASEGPAARWSWTEPAPQLVLKGSYRYQPAPNKEEPEVRRLRALNLDLKGKLGAFKLAATDLDLYLVEKLIARGRSPGQSWPDAVNTFQIEGTIAPAAFDLARRLELAGLKPWLTDPFLSATLRLNLDYDSQKDAAKLNELVFRQEDAPNAFWLKELDAVARLRGVRALARGVSARPPGTAVDLAGILDHLSEALVVKSLVFDAPAFARWQAQHPPAGANAPPREPSLADFVPAALAELLRTQRLVPQGLWQIRDLAVWDLANQERAWGLMGRFQNDLNYTLPPETILPPGRVALAPVLELKGPWYLPEKDAASITLSPDGRNCSLALRARLDEADVTVRGLLPDWGYGKPAGQPLRLDLTGACAFGREGEDDLVEMKTLALKGGPLQVDCADLQARIRTPAGQPAQLQTLGVGHALLQGGPLFHTCGLEGFRFDRGENRLRGSLHATQLSLTALTRVLPRFPGLTIEGVLPEAALEYEGDVARLAALDPNPARDRLQCDAQFQDLTVTAESSLTERVAVQVTGRAGLSAGRLDGRDLDLTVLYAPPPEAGAKATVTSHQCLISQLLVAAIDPAANLRQALQKEPWSLQLNLPLIFKTPLDLDALRAAGRVFRKVWYKGQLPAPPREGTNPHEWLSGLRLEGSLSTPLLKSGALALERFEAPRCSLRELKLNLPLYGFRFAGGDLIVSRALYDLGHPEVNHTQHFELAKAVLKDCLSLGPAGYQASGVLNAEGDLAGVGRTPNRSWSGGVDVSVQDLAFLPPRVDGAAPPTLLEAPWAAGQPPLVRRALANLGGRSAVSAAELLQGLPALSGNQRSINAAVLATQVLLSAYGHAATRLEFEPARIQVAINSGIAELRPVRLIGRGEALGLELGALGRVRWDGVLDDRIEIWPLRLPDSTRGALKLEAWPAAVREQFNDEVTKGKLPLAVTGSLSEPRFEFPLEKILDYLRRAFPPPPPPPPGVKPPVKDGARGAPGRLGVEPAPAVVPADLPPPEALFRAFERLRNQEVRP